ncbi:hypothetical protein J7E45_07170 [Microbacterium sp. ISL-59]|uniref:hypothetical protein n=1 Tax=Microbacterium sp. ISL-59 TaxID=2819159 RepID=UPI001BE63945|nr:hypothetical protein [Microbacterium sp. ISL-59]MBT2495383.1 hypothetical protein [Microbacterium sp. ISL-59]
MHRSGTSARLITVIIAVVVAPFGAGLIATGGSSWVFAYGQYALEDVDLGRFAMSFLLQAVGILLLLLVAMTGIWSSAGLIAVGVLALVPLVISLFPALLLEAYRLGAGILPVEWLDGLAYGLPLILLPVLGTMGLVLAMVRRRPEATGAGLAIGGLIVAPVLLLAGVLLLSWGLGRTSIVALQQYRFDFVPEAAAAVLIGTLAIIAGVFVTRWSRFALVLPALALLVVSALVFAPRVLLPALSLLPMEGSRPLSRLILVGGGTAAAILYLGFTAVLTRVRAQAATTPSVVTPDPASAPYPPTPEA